MKIPENYDFSGWVTKKDILCTDGVTIRQDAFSGNNGMRVPIVWQHNYSTVSNVLGYMLLHSLSDGIYGFGFLSSTKEGKDAKELIKHGDLDSLSIGANKIRKNGTDVVHGNIYEVSLVLSGANPGAKIEYSMQHSGNSEESTAIISHTGINIDDEGISEEVLNAITLAHADEKKEEAPMADENKETATTETETAQSTKKEEGSHNIGGVSFTDAQYDVVENLVAGVIAEYDGDEEDDDEDKDEDLNQGQQLDGEDYMKHNAFNNQNQVSATTPGFIDQFGEVITHDDVNNELANAIQRRDPSLAQSLINLGMGADVDRSGAPTTPGLTMKHGLAIEFSEGQNGETLQHSRGLENIDVLFPATTTSKGLQTYDPDSLNVEGMLNTVSKSPLSRVKNIFSDLTEETARARGYIKGNEKMDSIQKVYFRETTPGTIVRKTSFDRDDMLDIQENGIDILAYLQQVQLSKLKQEIVRQIMIGDGRPDTVVRDGSTINNPDKINPEHLRPIFTDHDLFTIKMDAVATWAEFPDALADVLPAYMGSGKPTLFINPFDLAELRKLKDANGRRLFAGYASGNALPTVETMASDLGLGGITEYRVMPRGQFIIVNLADYVLGASKGGQVANFDFFDIDFNVQKFLIETRLSGALQTPKSAIAGKVTTVGNATAQANLAFPATGLDSAATWKTDSSKTAANAETGE